LGAAWKTSFWNGSTMGKSARLASGSARSWGNSPTAHLERRNDGEMRPPRFWIGVALGILDHFATGSTQRVGNSPTSHLDLTNAGEI